MLFDENALKAMDEKLSAGLGPNLRGGTNSSYRPSQTALQMLLEQHGRRMLDTCASTGNVALTTVEGTAEQGDITNAATVRPAGSSIYGPFEDGFGSTQVRRA